MCVSCVTFVSNLLSSYAFARPSLRVVNKAFYLLVKVGLHFLFLTVAPCPTRRARGPRATTKIFAKKWCDSTAPPAAYGIPLHQFSLDDLFKKNDIYARPRPPLRLYAQKHGGAFVPVYSLSNKGDFIRHVFSVSDR